MVTTLLLILSCHRYAHKRAEQRSTWLPHLSIPYLHVVGDATLSVPWVFDEAARLLTVCVPDDYVSLPSKVVAALAAVVALFPRLEYVFKTDDDQHMASPATLTHLATKLGATAPPRHHYGGHLLRIEQPHHSKYHLVHPELPADLPILPTTYCTGRFYFLSRAAIDAVVAQRDAFRAEYFEDYAIGRHLPDALKQSTLNFLTERFFADQQP
jgi:hypothetical protein